MSEETKTPPQVKQGAVTPRSLRVEGFRGAYLDTRFNDQGLSEGPVSSATEKALREQFPGAKIEAVREKSGPEETK
jgi:hypothetical protein